MFWIRVSHKSDVIARPFHAPVKVCVDFGLGSVEGQGSA